MELINAGELDKFARKHRDAAKWLGGWERIVHDAVWRSLRDVREVFPHADGVQVKNKRIVTVFNVKGNEYRMLTRISYELQTVWVLELMTHEEYDRNNQSWKKRL
jgi:mRNA interferase HigB